MADDAMTLDLDALNLSAALAEAERLAIAQLWSRPWTLADLQIERSLRARGLRRRLVTYQGMPWERPMTWVELVPEGGE